MKKLKRFNKSNKKNIMPLVVLCAVVAVVSATISYAVYQKEDEIPFINARVGHFEESKSDIELAMKLDGEDIDTPPEKSELYEILVECDNATGRWDNNEWTAVIGNITSNRVKCNVNFNSPAPVLSEITIKSAKTSLSLNYSVEGVNVSTTCKWGTSDGDYSNQVDNATNTNCTINDLEEQKTYYYQICVKGNSGEDCKTGSARTATLAELVEIGDYIRMTPTSTSYTISKAMTAYSSDQEINPSELNLWRVIKKNEDGTVDVVSTYISSKQVYFSGQVGYMNFVGGLNTIAAQYANSKYVLRTRHMGYSNQVEECGSSSPSECTGDTGYTIDIDLVKVAIGSIATKCPSGTCSKYWLASRYYHSPSGGYNGRYVDYNGTINSLGSLYDSSGSLVYTTGFGIRPILTLKSTNGIIDGDGKSIDTAYQFA